MSQINYIAEIIEELLHGPNHIRGLAKTLGTNQTTIARKMEDLVHLNAVDFRTEGRNKSYFLKNSMEAFQLACISAHYRQIAFIKKHPELRRIIAAISVMKDAKISLIFGSYAKGTEGRNSDIDVFMETSSRVAKKKAEALDSRLSVKIGELDANSTAVKEMIKKNVIIKGAEDFYGRTWPFGVIEGGGQAQARRTER